MVLPEEREGVEVPEEGAVDGAVEVRLEGGIT